MDASLFADIAAQLENSFKPYNDEFEKFDRLPMEGIGQGEILELMEKFKTIEEAKWQDGFVSGAVYHGNEAYIDFITKVYAINSQSNPIHPDIWPSASKFEAEVVSMTAKMLGADKTSDEIVGTVSSGGTESILLAMKTYRDWARETKGISEPEIIVPTTAHAAFTKAGDYFRIKVIRIPVGDDFRADIEATKKAINENTIALVGSAPPFPHGIVDPIEELSALALDRKLGFHTDACLGGFILPWAEKLGYEVPVFDFRLPGVTSISVDTHKYGYAAKGTSVILYRGAELRHHQYFSVTDWPGGFYVSPTFAGSRPGALIAAAWAAMVSMGESGYLEAAQRILSTTDWLKRELRELPEIQVIGDPLFMVAFRSDALDIYQVMDYMTGKNWGLNGLQLPPSVHICITQRHVEEGVKERFLEDLKSAIAYVKENPKPSSEMGPIYGMAASEETRGMVKSIFNMFLDILYRV